MTSLNASNRTDWQRFFDRGGWWKAVLVAAAYLLVYELVGLLIRTVFAGSIADDLFSGGVSVFFGLGGPILVGAALLFVFARMLGWTREVFGPQPIRGSWWMWLAPVIVVGFNLIRFVSVDWAGWDGGAVVAVLATGVFVGVAEEVLTRGFAVQLLRRAGYREWAVMVLSSLLFALLHTVNLIDGQSPVVVALTVPYTFAFGLAMYLVLRVTGNIIWPILVHASTDPSLILLSGGVDAADSSLHPGPLAPLAGAANLIVVLFAIVPLLAVRGRVPRDAFAPISLADTPGGTR